MRKIRWGLIGCGDIAEKRVAPALRDLPMCDLVAVSRSRAELAEAFAGRFGARRWHRTWQDTVSDEEIEAVYIATPVFLHADMAAAAAEKGKHVLCEKPMAVTVAECDRMISACRSAGVRLGIAYYRHFFPVIRRIVEIAASGEIGKVVVAQIDAFERFNPKPGEPRFWLMQKALAGGGPMFDFGCHRIEVFLHLLGPVARVSGSAATVLYDRAEVEDTASAVLDFQSGSHAVLTVTHACFESRDTLDLFGSLGSVHVPILNAGRMRVRTQSGEREEHHPPHPNIHQPLIEDFTMALLEDREPVVGGMAGREVNRILAELQTSGCLYQSTASGGGSVNRNGASSAVRTAS